MGNITRHDPYADMLRFRRFMDRWFDDSLARPLSWRVYEGEPMSAKVDIHQDDENLYVTASLPGVQPEDVEVTLAGQMLSIRGELKGDETVERDQYLYRERRFGQFSRQLELPVRVTGEGITAAFETGLLKLTLPKAEDVKPRKIEITVAPETGASEEKPSA